MNTLPALTINPIGVIRTDMALKFDAPNQPKQDQDSQSIIELNDDYRLECALNDLAGFERIWLIWWFHKNKSWRPMVLPPRGSGKRRGVFATRSPHRPNPIGITSVPLISIQRKRIIVGSNDLLDGTPILDIKPYISAVDSFANMRSGWLEEVEAQLSEPARFKVELSKLAQEQASWLAERWKINFIPRVVEILQRDPSPHRTRRITKSANGLLRISCGAWRVYFSVEGSSVLLHHITPGYPPRLLNDPAPQIPHRQAQLTFLHTWP